MAGRARPMRVLLAAALAPILVAAAAPAPVAGGVATQLDETFGAGSVAVDVGLADRGKAVALRPDGTIVVAGAFATEPRGDLQPVLAQLTPEGKLDDSFGFQDGLFFFGGREGDVVDLAVTSANVIIGVAQAFGGRAFLFAVDPSGNLSVEPIDFGNDEELWTSLAVQPDGKVVVAGGVRPLPTDQRRTGIARFLAPGPDFGEPDAAFGTDGLVTEQLGAGFNHPRDIAVNVAGDRLAVVSVAFTANSSIRAGVLQLLGSNGSPDTGFSTDGKILVGTAAMRLDPGALAYQPNGRIVVSAETGQPKAFDTDPVLARIRPTGILDTSFSGDGLAPITFNGKLSPFSVFVSSSGITTVGQSASQDGIAAVRVTTAGVLDTTFDGDGRLVIGPPLSEVAVDAVLAPDGGFVTAGLSVAKTDTDIVVSRYLPSGAPDAAFAPSGMPRYPALSSLFGSESDELGTAIAVDASGRLLLAGVVDPGGEPTMEVLRILPNGHRDPPYGTGLGSGGRTEALFHDAEATDIVTSGNRAIVVGCQECSDTSEFAIAKFLASGFPDETFSEDGHAAVQFSFGALSERATSVALDQDGRAVIAGTVGDDVGLARLDGDGTPDETFGPDANGKVVTDIGSGSIDRVFDMVIQPNGRILVVGARVASGLSRIAVLRYLPSGDLDSSFSADGKVITGFGGTDVEGLGVALRPDGRILVAVQLLDGRVGVVRYTSTGGLDASFSGDGRADFALDPGDDFVVGVSALANDRIGIGGWNVDGRFFAARILPGGGLDTTFSGNGREYVAFEDFAVAVSLAVEPGSGRIVVVGEATGAGGGFDFAAARFDP